MGLKNSSHRKLSKEEVYIEYDLVKLFGRPLKPNEVIAFAEDVMEAIIQRTQIGIDRKNVKFRDYKESYINSSVFKKYNKSPLEINLTLRGDLLSSLDILEASGETLRIGIKDDLQSKKAFNHITGDTIPKRDFLGLPDDELEIIVERYKTADFSNTLINDLLKLKGAEISKDKLKDLLIDILESEEN